MNLRSSIGGVLVQALEELAQGAAAQVDLVSDDAQQLALEELGARRVEVVMDRGLADRPAPAVVPR